MEEVFELHVRGDESQKACTMRKCARRRGHVDKDRYKQ